MRGRSPNRTPARSCRSISLATTFAQEAVGKHQGYEYARSGNPTRTAMETCVASLEGAAHGLGFASGLAAEDAVLRTLDPGDHVILGNDAYGGTFRLVAHVHERFGINWTACDLRDLEPLAAAWQRRDPAGMDRVADEPDVERSSTSKPLRSSRTPATRSSWSTTRSPRRISSSRSPWVPTSSLHSSTKYLGGHSDVVGGFLALNDAEWADELRFLQNAMGAVPSPFDCYLVLRGVKTLAVRMQAHCENATCDRGDCCASTTRSWRSSIPTTSEVAARQMRDFGGMVSFLAIDEDAALEVVTRTRLFTLAESLGAVESLIEHPGAHDPCVGRGLTARSRSAPRAPVGRHRVDRRPRR